VDSGSSKTAATGAKFSTGRGLAVNDLEVIKAPAIDPQRLATVCRGI
jgi:hypothetical protein